MSDATQEYARQRQAMIDAARDGCGLSAGHAGAHFRGDHLAPENDACGARQARVLTTNHPEVTDPAEREWVCGRPCPDCGSMLTGMAHVCALPATPEPSIVLTGDEMAAYDAFALAAAKVEAQAEVMQKANADYRAALEQVSRMAAKRNRGG